MDQQTDNVSHRVASLFNLEPMFKLNYGPEMPPPPPMMISSTLLVVSDIVKHIFSYVKYQRPVPGPPVREVE